MENFKLKVFRVVADTLNFRRAAEELCMTQPAVTSQVKSLEESLGIALFDRIGRDISLTPAGATLLQYVRQIESLTNDALAALAPFGAQEGVGFKNRSLSYEQQIYNLRMDSSGRIALPSEARQRRHTAGGEMSSKTRVEDAIWRRFMGCGEHLPCTEVRSADPIRRIGVERRVLFIPDRYNAVPMNRIQGRP
jgi:DNA-binding MarR family transcriptional regulator